VSITHDNAPSDSDSEEKTNLMAKIIPFSSYAGGANAKKHHNPDKRRRVVEKDGDPNIQYKNISKRRRKYISDLFTTLVDMTWSESLFMFMGSFYLTWLLFALVYYVICYVHGDLEEAHLPKVSQFAE
jgi:hypothetical protein